MLTDLAQDPARNNANHKKWAEFARNFTNTYHSRYF